MRVCSVTCPERAVPVFCVLIVGGVNSQSDQSEDARVALAASN